MKLTERIDRLNLRLDKLAFVPTAPDSAAMPAGMPPMPAGPAGMPPMPIDPAAMGGMPVDPAGMPPDPNAMPPMPPEMMTGAPPMPAEEAAEPESVTLSMADLKAILAEASGGAGAEKGTEKKKSTQELLEGIEQHLIKIEEQMAGGAAGEAVPPDIASMLMGGAMPADPNAGMPVDPAAMGGMPVDPAAMGGMPVDPAAMGGMPVDPAAMPGPPAGPPPLTSEALKTAGDNREKWLAELKKNRGSCAEAIRKMSGYVRR